jgi:hypothetical protein
MPFVSQYHVSMLWVRSVTCDSWFWNHQDSICTCCYALSIVWSLVCTVWCLVCMFCFLNTSTKNCFRSSQCLLLLKLTGRQTLHTQWFPCRSWAGDAIHVPSVPPPAVHSGKCLIAKRYMCAAKSFEALLSILVARLADSPNATCVRPARFRQSRLAMTRQLGPVEGRQTLRKLWFLRFRYVSTKRF